MAFLVAGKLPVTGLYPQAVSLELASDFKDKVQRELQARPRTRESPGSGGKKLLSLAEGAGMGHGGESWSPVLFLGEGWTLLPQVSFQAAGHGP